MSIERYVNLKDGTLEIFKSILAELKVANRLNAIELRDKIVNRGVTTSAKGDEFVLTIARGEDERGE